MPDNSEEANIATADALTLLLHNQRAPYVRPLKR
jgi:hypothetical protein